MAEKKIASQELIIFLAPYVGIEPCELKGELFDILIMIGQGLIWSEEFHLRAKALAKDIEEEFASNLSANYQTMEKILSQEEGDNHG